VTGISSWPRLPPTLMVILRSLRLPQVAELEGGVAEAAPAAAFSVLDPPCACCHALLPSTRCRLPDLPPQVAELEGEAAGLQDQVELLLTLLCLF
jgi:hypothetical protein